MTTMDLQSLRDVLVMPDLITALLVAAILAVGGYLVDERIRGRLIVRRLSRSSDPDFEAFYELCRKTIDPEELEPRSEMARYLDDGERARKTPATPPVFEDYFAIAKRRNRVLGYVNATIYTRRRVGFINYLAIDTDDLEARRMTCRPLLRQLGSRVRKLGCSALLYEIDALGSALSRDENDKRLGRGRYFVGAASRAGFSTFELPVEYIQPQLSILPGHAYREVPLVLMYIPMNSLGAPAIMRRDECVELLEAVYLAWYLDIYDEDDPLRGQYEAYLRALVDRVTMNLPEVITLRRATDRWLPPLREGVLAGLGSRGVGHSPARRRRVARALAGRDRSDGLPLPPQTPR